jgi:hypothetical protein
VGGFAALPPAASAAELLYALDVTGKVVRFASDAPTRLEPVSITGIPADERILGLDVRPANGLLYVLTTGNRVYRIDRASGRATVVRAEPLEVPVNGAAVGFDVNPATDRIRFTTELGQNLRVHPDLGVVARRGGQLDIDGSPQYEEGDSGLGFTPRITAVAHTNNIPGTRTSDVLVLDVARDVLAVLAFPNRGIMRTRGPLGVDVADNAGFDVAFDGTAYAALQLAGESFSRLYTVNLANGAPSLIGRIGGAAPIASLAAVGPAQAAPLSVRAAVVGPPARIGPLVQNGIRVAVTCNRPCAIEATVRHGGIQVGRTATKVRRTKSVVTIRFAPSRRQALLRRARVTLTLVVRATAADGSSSEIRRTIRAVR